MNVAWLTDWTIFMIILVVTWLLLDRLERFTDKIYFRLNHFKAKEQVILSGCSKLEACSLSWLIGLLIYKYFVCPWRHLSQDWFSQQIWYGLLLFCLIESIEGIILFHFRHEKGK